MILLVEDNPAHAELIIRSFKAHQVVGQIRHIFNGEAALDYLYQRKDYADPQQNPRPHLILLDLRLPRINGLEVLKEIKKVDTLKKIPVVILTTSAAEEDVVRAYNYHANSYLVKPVDFDQFTQLMDNLVFYWLGWNHQPGP